jgi:hypothetical protein
MALFFRNKSDERGSVLIVALLILVLLTIIGISATTTTNIETQIAGNDKFHKIAFNNADSGIFPTAKVISDIMDHQIEPDEDELSPIVYLQNNGDEGPPDGTLFRELMGYDEDPGNPDNGADDIRFDLDGYEVNVNINRTGVMNIAGGATEFASGAEGIGVGAGGVAVMYNLDSVGEGPVNSQANIAADYRKVVNVFGGL